MAKNLSFFARMRRNKIILPRMVAMRAQGATQAEIAAKYGLSRSRVQAMLRAASTSQETSK